MGNLKEQWTVVLRTCERAGKFGLWLLVGIYRTLGTTHLGGCCRFEPSCSAYALEAIQKHNFFSAVYLILKRLFNCRPGGPFGYDPVPPCCGEKHAKQQS